MKTPAVLKTFAAAVLFGAFALLVAGCAQPVAFNDTDWVPGYDLAANGQRIGRYMHDDAEQMMDDVDRDVLMTRPSSKLTWWNVTQLD